MFVSNVADSVKMYLLGPAPALEPSLVGPQVVELSHPTGWPRSVWAQKSIWVSNGQLYTNFITIL